MTSRQQAILGWSLIGIFVLGQIVRIWLAGAGYPMDFSWGNIVWIVLSLIVVAAGIMLATGSGHRPGR